MKKRRFNFLCFLLGHKHYVFEKRTWVLNVGFKTIKCKERHCTRCFNDF